MPFRRESPNPDGPNTERVQKALDALAADGPVSDADLSTLTASERDEVAALTRTAHLTRLVLHADAPDAAAEAAALGRAQMALRSRQSGAFPATGQPRDTRSSTSWLGSLLDRLRDADADRR